MSSRRTLGYIENEWTCPNCNTRNKGGDKTCTNCGAPQPENVQFELGAEQKMVTDEKKIEAAQSGADIHCGFCGARNPATAETCSQCGGDLKEGKAREAGRVMQAPPPQSKMIKCNNCGTENASSNSVCTNCGSPLPRAASNPVSVAPPIVKSGIPPAAPLTGKKTNSKRNLFIAGGIVACLAVVCVTVLALFVFPTSSVQGTVTDIHWQTNVPVQEVRAVDHNNESGNPPSDAYNVSCHDESKDVCEQKTIDKGNGYSEVVEDCHTETTQYCSYTVDEWQTIQTYMLEGNDLQPIYDDPNLASGQRIGDKTEDLTVTFSTDKGPKTYSPGTLSEFQQFSIGTTWTLKMNLVGGVVSVK
jgi:ribosomal protein L40E